MLKVDYLHLAEDVKVDERGRSSIINIAGRLDVPAVPAGLKGMKVTAGIRAVDKPLVGKPLKMKLVLRGPNSEATLFENNQKFTIEQNYSLSPIFVFDTIVFPEFGNYQFELYINDKKMADTSLIVRDAAELSET